MADEIFSENKGSLETQVSSTKVRMTEDAVIDMLNIIPI